MIDGCSTAKDVSLNALLSSTTNIGFLLLFLTPGEELSSLSRLLSKNE